MSDHPQADRHTDQDIPGAGPPSHPDPRRDWHRRLTLAALTGWHQLPADRLHDLVGTADPDQLPTLVHTPGVLTTTDAGVLLSALMRRQDTAGHRWAHLLTAARLPDPTADPAARRDRLDLASRGFAEPVTTPQTDPSDRMVRTCWTTVPHRPSVPLTGHTGPVRAITTITLPDGRTLLAAGSDYETVRLWDPATGEQVGPTPTHHAEEMCAMAAVALPDGRTLLAAATTIAGEEWAVRLWDPTTGQQVGEDLTDHDGTVYAITTVALPDGRTLLATGSYDETVCLWDPATGEQVGDPLPGHTHAVGAITTITVPDGRTLLATGGADRTLRLWDPLTAEPIEVLHLPHPVGALTALPGGHLALGHGNETAVVTVRPASQQ